MISYAQNFEDVLLNRILREVTKGFYVDIGAYDPSEGSVTRHFYERGWRGINVEPGPVFERLEAERPRDVNLKVAVSDRAGTRIFYEHPEDPGTSTLAKSLHPNLHDRVRTRVEHSVKALTLAGILGQHARDVTIDFLKIDVEGHERQVLRGGDWRRFRPRVLVVEATQPYSNDSDHEDWEGILLEAGYLFAYFDGLNRYYLSEEESERLERFRAPVNVLDGFELAKSAAQRRDNEKLSAALAQAADANGKAEQDRVRLRREVERLHGELGRIDAFAKRMDEMRSLLVTQAETFRDQFKAATASARLAEEARARAAADAERTRTAAARTEEERASLRQEVERLHATVARVNDFAKQADKDRDTLKIELEAARSRIASMTGRAGPRALAFGLRIARATHRVGRWTGLAKPAALAKDAFAPGAGEPPAPQLKEILSALRQIQDHLARRPQGHEPGPRAGSAPASPQETDRLVLALLKMAQVGGLAGRLDGHVLDHVAQASSPRPPERRGASAASHGAGST